MSASVAEVEAKLRAAMDAAKASGIAIESRTLLRRNDSGAVCACCAIGSIVTDWPQEEDGAYSAAAGRLGICFDDALSVVGGFDRGESGTKWATLGARLRRDYLPGVS